MPEVGDLDKPKMVFFFDEAHLLFKEAPKSLVASVEQIVKLIRSKGIGIYFISQSPSDIPDAVLSQLQNRIQHALHAYTPAEMKAVNVAAKSFRVNPEFDTKEAISSLATGEALVSFLDEEGIPMMVERATILPPSSQIGQLDAKRKKQEIEYSDLYGKYEDLVDNETAYEVLEEVVAQEEAEEAAVKEAAEQEKAKKKAASKKSVVERAATNAASTFTREAGKDLVNSLLGKKSSSKKSALEKAANSAISTLTGSVGKTLTRGLFDILKGGK